MNRAPINDASLMPPSSARYKVYIIDEVPGVDGRRSRLPEDAVKTARKHANSVSATTESASPVDGAVARPAFRLARVRCGMC